MMHMVFRDYVAAFHWSNLKKRLNSNQVSRIVVIFYLSIPLSVVSESMKIGLLHYMMLAVPLATGFAMTALFPMGLTKLQFVCPMQESERKEYIWYQYWLKTAIPMGCFLIGMIALLLTGNFFGMQVFAEGSIVLMLLLAVNIELPEDGFRLLKGFTEISGEIVLLIICCFETVDWEPVVNAFIWILLGWQALFTGKILTFLKPAVRTAMDYEKTMEVKKA